MQDRVQAAEPDSGYELYIFSMYEKPNWRARAGGDRVTAPHPGSAISYQDRVYELLAILPAPDTPYAYRYALRAWEERFPIRKIFPYSAEDARAVHREIDARYRQQQRHGWGIRWFALTSLIATDVATRWEREWGLPMRRSAYYSVVWLAIVFGGLLAAAQRAENLTLMEIAGGLLVEQSLRLIWLSRSDRAVGSLPFTALWNIASLLTGFQSDGTSKGLKLSDFDRERDEVRYLTRGEDTGTQPWDLEVRSRFREPALLGQTPLRFEGQVYQPLEYIQDGEGIRRRYVFRLKRMDPATPARREYSPLRDETQVARLLPYERARNRVHVLAFFAGFLPYSRQLMLERVYDFPAGLWSQRAAKFLFVASAVHLWALYGSRFGLANLIGIYFLVESAWRLLVSYQRGDASGSLLGWLFLPFFPHE